ncbi:MAG: hypothetical protein IH828_09225 [Nitrospinae bacterium]|nr:hypothetical protein [Nitrospinota bacterium]
MPERSRKKKAPPDDVNVLATKIVKSATKDKSEPDKDKEKNPHAVALGRLGGKKGGPARAKKLSKKRRVEIAKKAAETRWRKK